VLAGSSQLAVAARRVEAGAILLPVELTKSDSTPLARPEEDEQPPLAVVGRADAVEALVCALHRSHQRAGEPRASSTHTNFVSPNRRGEAQTRDGAALNSHGTSLKPSPRSRITVAHAAPFP
jgi:hypothetical protein